MIFVKGINEISQGLPGRHHHSATVHGSQPFLILLFFHEHQHDGFVASRDKMECDNAKLSSLDMTRMAIIPTCDTKLSIQQLELQVLNEIDKDRLTGV